jgi:hypothetical protein
MKLFHILDICNKILDLIICKFLNLIQVKFFKKAFDVKNTKLSSGYDYFWFLLAWLHP